MKIKEKVQRRSRNIIISLAVIFLTPLCEEGRILNGAHFINAYAGKDIVCAIDLGNDMYGSHGLLTGMSYELVNRFAKDNHCNVRIVTAHRTDCYLDSLIQGKVDLVIVSSSDTLPQTGITALRKIDDYSSWIMGKSNPRRIRQMNSWLSYMEASEDMKSLKKRYIGSFNPHKRAERGIVTTTVSPYDDLFRKYAKDLGWDWRMIAAVVYQESKFSIASVSSRGATGLMQVMPQTGLHYGSDNLLDPEKNIFAGTSHLKRLQKIFVKHGLEQEELIKFTLAAYNAGEGRIMDCRNLAAAKGFDNTKWDEIVKVIPLMRNDDILLEESVKLGKFQGHETIDYIESVISHYQAICRICPTSF